MTQHRNVITLALFLLAWNAVAAMAGTLPIAPPASRITFRLNALGWLGLTGHFQQFQGTATVPPAQGTGCTVQVKVAVASLAMDNPAWTARALGPSLLAANAYPDMLFTGNCRGDTLAGTLTLHGVTRPLTLALRRDDGAITATGHLRRGDYQVSGMPLLIGQQITIEVQLPTPNSLK